jgi:hypothetical protein
MMERRRLANRRLAVAFEFLHRDQRYRAQIGYFTDGGGIAEIFLDAAKPDSALDAFAADAAILISLLLQHGSPLGEIGHALRRCPNGEPASLIGSVIDCLRQMEAPS